MYDASFERLLEAHTDTSSSSLITGQNLSSTAYLAYLHSLGPDKRPTVVVVPSEENARDITQTLKLFFESRVGNAIASDEAVLQLPAHDLGPYSDYSGEKIGLRTRMGALYCLANSEEAKTQVIVVSAASLQRKTIEKSEYLALCDRIEVGGEIDLELLSHSLISAGFCRSNLVEQPGQFAVRGGVVDLFPSLYRFPIRMELFGDEVESIRHFDAETQRTLVQLDSLVLHPVRETMPTKGATLRSRLLEAADLASHPSKASRALIEQAQSGSEFIGIEKLVPAFHQELVPVLSYLPDPGKSPWIIYEAEQVLSRAQAEREDAERRYQEQLDSHLVCFPPGMHYVDSDTLSQALGEPGHFDTQALQLAGSNSKKSSTFHIPVDDNIGLRGKLERVRKNKSDDLINPLVEAIADWRERDFRVVLVCATDLRLRQLSELLESRDILCQQASSPLAMPDEDTPDGFHVTLCRGTIPVGFTIVSDSFALLKDSDILGDKRKTSRRQSQAAKRARDALKGGVADFSQLAVDDFLVHNIHGLGQYKGLRKLPIQGVAVDFLHLEYKGGNLYLPVVRIGEVSRYVGDGGLKPRLDKLGGQTFAKTKRSVSKKVRALAEELLILYAERKALPGHSYPPPDALFHEFESSFEFEETPDQQRAIDEVSQDMSGSRPMDRLVCGDVGYGKTEVALRAILRAVFGNKQAAFLAPTTVLVEQHYQSMCKRFANWPIRIARLSRFQTNSQQLVTLKKLASGELDAVVGTHRLLSKDVRFKELGLLVIDEEQRFGVAHKERFKKMRSTIEVLTLTATPIPRTLHFAMTGLRDLSIIATPPVDRRAIRTFVARSEDSLMREAIEKELDREGQVFFVSPRIDSPIGGGDRSLEEWATHLKNLVPRAKIAVAHGRLSADKLEQTMIDFVAGRYDILVATTIVEAGLDIPRANTMFIDRADRFGLSQLYQLRGRIGRSKNRAYCYLLVPAPDKLSDDARKRLETLQRHTELGAGFAIASQDLELRGAGDLLGAKQSGSIAAIGFDAYTQMLEEAVAELQGLPIKSERDPELNVDIPGYIPDDYIPDTGQRLALYKRLACAADEEEVRDILEELADCYGPIPGEVGVLGELMVVKSYARKLSAVSLELGPTRLALALGDHTPLDPVKVVALVNKAKSLYTISKDQRLVRQFSKQEREHPVNTAKAALLELLACATPEATGNT